MRVILLEKEGGLHRVKDFILQLAALKVFPDPDYSTSNLATPTKPVIGKGLKGPFFSKLRSFEALRR